MEYFGTNLSDHGHYRWTLSGDTMIKKGILFNDLPFHPEDFVNNLPKGETVFIQLDGYTIFAISGSCVDKRSGSKSVFWIKDIISKDEMIKKINLSTIAMKIINSMSFNINWK